MTAAAVIEMPAALVAISERLESRGYRCWLVGGCVRDTLMGRPVHDWDVATSAHPAQVQHSFRRVIPTGIAHGTVTVLVHNQAFEVTTLRTEGAYRDGRHPEAVAFVDDIAMDLARRDFTINAMAYRPRDQCLVDPFGGRQDIVDRQIRAVGSALDRFREDGLRLMRAARFAATLDFALDPETRAAMTTAVPVLRQVSRERWRDELWKTLCGDAAATGLTLLQQCGALAVVLPALADGDSASERWHRCLQWFSAVPTLPWLRLAALLCFVRQAQWVSVDVKSLQQNVRQLPLSRQERAQILGVLSAFAAAPTDPSQPVEWRRWMASVGREIAMQTAALLAIVHQDRRYTEQSAQIHDSGAALSIGELAINGAQLQQALQQPPGPMLGQLLRQLLDFVLEDPKRNQTATLLAQARCLQHRGCADA